MKVQVLKNARGKILATHFTETGLEVVVQIERKPGWKVTTVDVPAAIATDMSSLHKYLTHPSGKKRKQEKR